MSDWGPPGEPTQPPYGGGQPAPPPPPPPYGGGQPPPYGGGQPPPYGGGQPPPYGGGQPPPYGGGQPPPYGGGQPPPYGGGQPPYGGGPYGRPPGGRGVSARTLVAIGVAFALVVGIVAGALLVAGDDDDNDDEAAGEEGEIFLEPVSSTSDPFTDSVASPTPPGGPTTTTSTTAGGGTTGIQSIQGSRPGLYGGTRSETSCDRVQLVEYLEDNQDKGHAWADVLDIEYEEIETYVNTLTPVLLTHDTRVTNHGYRSGHATVINSVLQAGTAVLVDHYGAPVVRCYCGNPLVAPRALSRPRYTGSRWAAFSPSSLTVVQQTTVVIQQLVLIDWRTGEYFARPVGTDGGADTDAPGQATTTTTAPTTTTTAPPTPRPAPAPAPAPTGGDLQVTLSWNTTDDMDLSVTDPSGETASLSGGTSSGGNLDTDANRGCTGTSSSPVETASWANAPPGPYSVSVNYFQACGDGAPVTFTVTATSGGAVVSSVTDTLGPNESRTVATFTL